MSLINSIKREKRKRHEDVSHVLKKPKNTMCVSVHGTAEDVDKGRVVSVLTSSAITNGRIMEPPPGFEMKHQEMSMQTNLTNTIVMNENDEPNNHTNGMHTFSKENSVRTTEPTTPIPTHMNMQKNVENLKDTKDRGGHIKKYEAVKGKKTHHEKAANGGIEKSTNKVNSKKDLCKKKQKEKRTEKGKKEKNDESKKKKKNEKNSNDLIWEGLLKKDVILILVQAIKTMGYNKTAKLLEAESGIQLEQPLVKEIHTNVLLGNWDDVILGLKKLRINKKLMKAIGFLVYEQCYIESLYVGRYYAALRCLRNKLSKCCVDEDTYQRLHQCSTFLMYLNDERFIRKKEHPNFCNSRKILFEKINRLLPESIIIPPRRLAILLHQSLKYQVDNCLFHNNFSDTHLIKQLLKRRKGLHGKDKTNFLQLINGSESIKKKNKKRKNEKGNDKRKNSSGTSAHKHASNKLVKSKKKKDSFFKYDEDEFELKFDNPNEFAFLLKQKEDKDNSGTEDIKNSMHVEGKDTSKETEDTLIAVGENEKNNSNACTKKNVKRKHTGVGENNELALKENETTSEEVINHHTIDRKNETPTEYYNEKKQIVESSSMNNNNNDTENCTKKKSACSEKNNEMNNVDVSEIVKVVNKNLKCNNTKYMNSTLNIQKEKKNVKTTTGVDSNEEALIVKKKKKHKKKKKGKEETVQNGCATLLGFSTKNEDTQKKVCNRQLVYSISLLKNHECKKLRLPYYCIKILHGHKDEVWYVSVSSDGKYIASSSKDKSIILWKAKSPFNKLREWNGHIDGVSTIAWSHNSKYLLSGSNDSNVIIWSPKSNKKKLSLNMHSGPITSVCWSQDDSIILSSGFDKKIYCTRLSDDMKNYYFLYTWVFSTRIQNIVLTNNDKYLIVAASDKNVRIFDFNMKTELYTLPEIDSITSICPSNLFNHILVNVGDQRPTIKLWDVKYRYIIQTYRGHKQGRFIVHSSFGGTNENYVISGSEDSLIYIWHKLKGYLLDIINGHASTVNIALWPLSYSKFPYMISASDDHTLMLWNIKPNCRRKKKKLKEKKGKKQKEKKKKKTLHPFLRELRHMSMKNKKEE